ncbi:uncharacterized protein EKO05_0008266 [Ascochyta rabiei]|uniref:uncharacterized protein n=1 Tax=Didymella rabiei TaxID=5454 RepID=UPI001901D3E3|nr:uncharacterized protein EKO05_0008266 [Ascochyta rabiei]UPX17940.1 hypothetical protein EKO05_0008266 [Ascochyta rabiei]
MSQSCPRRNTEDDGGTSTGVEAVQDQTQTVGHSVDHNKHDDRGHPAARMQSPSTKSWSSENEELSPRASTYYCDLYTTEGYAQSTHCDPTYLKPSTLRTTEARTASTVTVFPSFQASVKESNPDSSSEWSDVDTDVEQRTTMDLKNQRGKGQSYIKRLKEIYRAGPPGEGQLLWRGLRDYWRERRTGVVFEMYQPHPTDESSRVPSPEFVVEEEVADPRQRRSPTAAYVTGEGGGQRRLRNDSVVSYGDVSRTSREVPIKIRRTVLELDTNKCLPPQPPLGDAPRGRSQRDQGRGLDLNKPLPRTPFPCFPMPPKPPEGSEESAVAPPWPPTYTATVGSESSDCHNKVPSQGSLKHVAQDPQLATRLLRSPATRAPDAQPSPTGTCKPSGAEQAHDVLKAKISAPMPPSPAAVAGDFSPRRPAPHPDTASEKARGKPTSLSSAIGLDRLAHPARPWMPWVLRATKRLALEESFTCQGVVEGLVCGACTTESERDVREDGARMGREDEMRPEPLFTGGMFDGSYCDVEDGKAEERKTGRWI